VGMKTINGTESPKTVLPMQAYKRHITSEFLSDRYPYLEDIRGHLKEDDVSMAFGDRLFPRLVEQLKSPNMAPEKLIEALRTICDLCAHQENKCQAIASDTVAAATHLLMHDHVPVRRDAARVISSMALMMGGRSLMPLGSSNMSRKLMSAVAAGPTLPCLAKLLLSCNDELVKRHVAEAMRSVTLFRDGCQQLVNEGTVKAVAQYLCATLPRRPSSSPLGLCLLHLLYTLAAVTMYAHNGMRDLFGVGLIAKLIAFLDAVAQDSEVSAVTAEEYTDTQRQALRLLWHTCNDPQGRSEVLKASGVRVITAYLANADAKVREAAVCALNVASLETQGKKDLLLSSVEGLASLLHSEEETQYLHETCVQLCRSASELPAFRFTFARHILRSIWLLEKIYGTTSLAAVSPLVGPKEPEEMRVQAVQVMLHFLRPGELSKGDQIRVPPVTPLHHIEEPPMFAIEECVDILHNLIDLLPVAERPVLECLDAITEADRPREELRALIASRRITVPQEFKEGVERCLRKDVGAATH